VKLRLYGAMLNYELRTFTFTLTLNGKFLVEVNIVNLILSQMKKVNAFWLKVFCEMQLHLTTVYEES
jgi:hypothetical protein